MSAVAAAGRRPGRPGGCRRDLVIRMYRLHYDEGLSYERISDILNAEDVPLPGGGSYWLRSSVERVMNTNYGRVIGKELGFG
jgi:hypothetical protein